MWSNNESASYQLRELDVQITNRCPLNCRHCCCESGAAQHPGVSTEALLSLFREAKDMGVEAVHLTGGEPLLRDDLPQLVQALHDLSLDVEIQSSWIDHPNLQARFPTNASTDVAVISLDGLQECHDYYRGQGSFARVTDRLHSLVAEGRRVRVNTILTRRSLVDVAPLLKYTGQAGVETHAIFYFSPIGRGRKIVAEWLPPVEMVAATNELLQIIADERAVLPPTIYLQPGYRIINDRKAAPLRCRMLPRDFLFVLSDGRAVPCSWYIEAGISCGNAFEEGLSAVYKQFLEFVGEAAARLAACRDCQNYFKCLGGCDAARLLANAACDPRCCSPEIFFPGCPERKVTVK